MEKPDYKSGSGGIVENEFKFLEFNIVYVDPDTHPSEFIKIPCKLNVGYVEVKPCLIDFRLHHWELLFRFSTCESVRVPLWRKANVRGESGEGGFPLLPYRSYLSYVEFSDGSTWSESSGLSYGR